MYQLTTIAIKWVHQTDFDVCVINPTNDVCVFIDGQWYFPKIDKCFCLPNCDTSRDINTCYIEEI